MSLSLRAQKDQYREDIEVYRLGIQLLGQSGYVNVLQRALIRTVMLFGGKYYTTRQVTLPRNQLSEVLIIWFESHEELEEGMKAIEDTYGSRWYGVEQIKLEDKGKDILTVTRDIPYFPEPEVD